MLSPTEYPWFYAPELPAQGEVTLNPEETRHMKAQRVKTEEKVSLFNGKGIIGVGTLLGTGKVRLLRVSEAPRSKHTLTLAVAVPKGERADWMLQKLTELGVATIIPLKSERSVVLPREAKQERWQKILIEACKQSKQSWIPELRALSTIDQAAQEKASLKLLLDQHGKPVREALQQPPASTLAFVGPEGGFTDEEKRRLQNAGCIAVSLGSQTLRIETAAMAIATAHNLFK
jgi:16S rRNA (uracil1498-N3)-methyltransferase